MQQCTSNLLALRIAMQNNKSKQIYKAQQETIQQNSGFLVRVHYKAE